MGRVRAQAVGSSPALTSRRARVYHAEVSPAQMQGKMTRDTSAGSDS